MSQDTFAGITRAQLITLLAEMTRMEKIAREQGDEHIVRHFSMLNRLARGVIQQLDEKASDTRSRREAFAAYAVTGILANPSLVGIMSGEDIGNMAVKSFQIADEMMMRADEWRG